MFGIDDSFVQQCLDTFPHETQLDMLQEECAELIKACAKMKRDDGHWSLTDPYDALKEEITHVLISSAVVARIYSITEEDIEHEVNKKRQKYKFKKML
jgi:NTP pyrophosphatase (non-canonical NTP hydrolase)